MNKKFKKVLIFSLISLSLFGCENLNTNTKNPNPKTEVETEVKCSLCEKLPTAQKVVIDNLAAHVPTTFNSESIAVETKQLYEGVIQKTFTFTKNNGKTSKVVVTEVDLAYANIAAGTTLNSFSNITKSVPIKQATSFENANPNTSVLAAVNGDFFGGDSCVNAFVKDSIIIKNSHNDRGIYDYKNLDADIPASMPMLFGVSGTTAQVAPIIKDASVKDTIQAKLYYEVEFTNENNKTTLAEGITFNNAEGSDTLINVLTDEDGIGTALPGSKVLSIKKHPTDSTRMHGEITEITEILGSSLYRANEDYFYIIIPENSSFTNYNIGDLVSYNVTSSDGTWKYYDTIIGCRQALVINGEIASTVSKENSNGAQATNVPRTSVGVMPNGNVCIFSVEALSYGNKLLTNETNGLSLPELADFMRYYGVYSGANFDGGGSTQLITKNPQTNEFEVTVRSSDYGTYVLENSRPVINTLLVYVKEK